ncbi:MAG: response regulator [Elusimicrobiota bacterium]
MQSGDEQIKKPIAINECVLVVEDDNDLRPTFKNVLEGQGFKVTATASGNDALSILKEKYHDLIVLDVRMPGINGIELLKRIREIQINDKSHVIFVTGYASEDVPVEALKLGADDYIKKPFELPEFIRSVNSVTKLIREEKDKKYFFKKMVERSQKLKENEIEISNLKKRIAELEGKIGE